MPNKANLEATLAAITANPGHWYQQEWHCGTSHCFAGFAEMLRLGAAPNTILPGSSGGYSFLQDSELTRRWLGLDWLEWQILCDGGNTLNMLRDHVRRFCEACLP